MDLKELFVPDRPGEQILDSEPPTLIDNKVLEDKPSGQHHILDIAADSYDKVLELCTNLGYSKILKVKRLPHYIHATTCLSLLPPAKDKLPVPCNCHYVTYSKESLRPLPVMNRYKVTVMANEI
jgi:hypothetical protein